MKNLKTYIYLIALVSFSIISCDSYTDNVDPLTGEVEDELLDDEDQIGLLITGLKGFIGSTGDQGDGISRLIWRASGYSDEMIHGLIRGGAPDHVSFVQDFPPDLRFYEGDYESVNIYHFLADDLVRRINRVDAANPFENTDLKDEGLWWGNVVSGLSRMYLADLWGAGLSGNNPGAPITSQEQLDNQEYGAFYSSTELHAQAREKFTAALGLDPGDVPNPDKVVWSFIARTYLFDGMYSNAKSAAEQGLQQGDETMQTLHDARFPNQMYDQSGRSTSGDFLFTPHPRFIQYVLDDRKEGEIISELTQDDIDDGVVSRSLRGIESEDGEPGNIRTSNPRSELANQNERLPLWERLIETSASAIGDDSQWTEFKEGGGYVQDYYTDADDPFDLIDWREVELILAEVAIDAGDNITGLGHINNVRAFHSLDPYDMTDMTSYDNPKGGASQEGIAVKGLLSTNNKYTGPWGLLIEERDKTLWMKGTRLADQKRFDLWHLEGSSFYKFYMPIPRSETDVNPNIPD